MDEQEAHWHLKKEVSISQIVAIITVAVSLVIGWQKLNERMALIEAEQAHGKESDVRLEQQLRDSVSRIEAAIIRMESTLNSKADKKGR